MGTPASRSSVKPEWQNSRSPSAERSVLQGGVPCWCELWLLSECRLSQQAPRVSAPGEEARQAAPWGMASGGSQSLGWGWLGAVPGRGGGCGPGAVRDGPWGPGRGRKPEPRSDPAGWGAETSCGGARRDLGKLPGERPRSGDKRDAERKATEPPQGPGGGRPLAVHRGIVSHPSSWPTLWG